MLSATVQKLAKETPGWSLPAHVLKQHYALLHWGKGDFDTAGDLLEMSEWGEARAGPKNKMSLAMELDNIVDGSLARSLLALQADSLSTR